MIRCAVATLSFTLLLALPSACPNSFDSSSSKPAQANEQVAMDAGSLRLVITASPWAMTFVDAAGEGVIAIAVRAQGGEVQDRDVQDGDAPGGDMQRAV